MLCPMLDQYRLQASPLSLGRRPTATSSTRCPTWPTTLVVCTRCSNAPQLVCVLFLLYERYQASLACELCWCCRQACVSWPRRVSGPAVNTRIQAVALRWASNSAPVQGFMVCRHHASRGGELASAVVSSGTRHDSRAPTPAARHRVAVASAACASLSIRTDCSVLTRPIYWKSKR